MIFKRENAKSIAQPTAKMLARELKKLKSNGRSAYAYLTDDAGNYIQTAGGSALCLLERRDVITGKHFRAYQNPPIVPPEFNDGTLLCFSAGEIALNRNEWFTIAQVITAFVAFSLKTDLPDFINWRDISAIFQTE